MDLAKRIFLAVAIALLVWSGRVSAQGCDDYLVIVQREYPAYLETSRSEFAAFVADTSARRRLYFPSHLQQTVVVAAEMYRRTGDEREARRTIELFLKLDSCRRAYPDSLARKNPEYRKGVPMVVSFFYFPVVVRAYDAIKESPSLLPADRKTIEDALMATCRHMMIFPEWGPMNRAIIKALGFLYMSQVFPQHPEARRWRKMAQVLAYDNLEYWSIEDAQFYQAIWLYHLILYAEASGDTFLFTHPTFRYYFDYFLHLASPLGTPPPFGDSRIATSHHFLIAAFEWAANYYTKPGYKWYARRLLERSKIVQPVPMGGYNAMVYLDAYRWCSDNVAAAEPHGRSSEVMEDVIGKKIVFRNGFDAQSTFMLLNYRDEGGFAPIAREYIRNTIPVEEEKMHHGHADENSIVSLIKGQSVLLHSSGYRNGLPSGPWGAYRADYFQNRLLVRNRKRGRNQNLFEFLRDAGSHQPVRTEKIDFLRLSEVDMSRTRLHDDKAGYQWDRVVTWLKEDDVFVVVDIVKFLRTDFYTLANFWHVGSILERRAHSYLSQVDSIRYVDTRGDYVLTLDFPAHHEREDSTFVLDRWFSESNVVYQTLSSHYHAGHLETFVTVLAPVDRARAARQRPRVEMLPIENERAGVGLRIHGTSGSRLICVKSDLWQGILNENRRPRYTYASGKVAYGPVETDASFFYAREHGDSLHYAASTPIGIEYNGRMIFQTDENSFGLQPDDLSENIGRSKWRYWEDTVAMP